MKSKWLLFGGMASLFLAAVIILAFLATRRASPQFSGTVLDPPRETLGFTLRNQSDETVRWADYRGKVVVLTFLYTHCPDACPLTTAKLRQTYDLLGKRAGEVAFVAVTVDPERDSVQRIREYSQEWGMLDKWDFLTGSEAELRPLWDWYWAGSVRKEAMAAQGSEERHQTAAPPSTETSASSESGDYIVEHSAPVHLIDRQGWTRVAYGTTFGPEGLAKDIGLLLG